MIIFFSKMQLPETDYSKNFFYRFQSRNIQSHYILGLCAFLPIDARKIEIVDSLELKLRYRENKLDLPQIFKTSCLRCVSMFMNGVYTDYIPHCSSRHSEIKIHENAYFYKKYYQQMIKNLIVPSPFLLRKNESKKESKNEENEKTDEIIKIENNNLSGLIEEIESSFSNFEKQDEDFDNYISQYEISTSSFLHSFSQSENGNEENEENINGLKQDKVILYKNNNQFLKDTETMTQNFSNELKKRDELIIQLIQQNYTTKNFISKKFITKKIYVKQSNSIYIFYFIITCAVLFMTIFR